MGIFQSVGDLFHVALTYRGTFYGVVTRGQVGAGLPYCALLSGISRETVGEEMMFSGLLWVTVTCANC